MSASPLLQRTPVLAGLPVPIVLAPLAGGPSTPELAAAVSNAGGLGFLAGGYLSAEALADRLDATRRLTDGPLGVNLFVPGAGPAPAAVVAAHRARVAELAAAEGLELGEPKWDDDGWEAKLAVVQRQAPAVVSFTFGCPPPEVIGAVRRAGSEAWVTITSPGEARGAAAAGADALVVQGAEAGGHRASFRDDPELEPIGLLALLGLVGAAVDLPLVASGGIGSGAGLAAALCAGATAAQLGSAFLLAPEAGTASAHRQALARDGTTVLTRAFSGRLARGIRNRFMTAVGAGPVAYPEVHHLTAPLRRQARERGDAGLINLWAGQAFSLARERPAGESVRQLAAEAHIALARASAIISSG
ncbi:MAG TPA: nitronate monooxygenase [Solirubrobacteraceae bacterium]|nr:nitronate monooxygenase [Solirubrobacteraceae bacterium]